MYYPKKDNYILASLASIGRNKKWELYVVTRIIHLLNDNDLEFACQKYVKHKKKMNVDIRAILLYNIPKLAMSII